MAKKVFHVDDDPEMLEAVRRILTLQDEFEVFGFQNSGEMLEQLKKVRPDAVILDVMVEGDTSGLNAFEKIRAMYPGVPILMLTSLGDTINPFFEDRNERPWILEKPITPDKLIASLRLCMRTGHVAEPGKS